MTWTAYEMDDAASVPVPMDDGMIAVCPYCGREHQTDVVNAWGECPATPCCGEMHCLIKGHPDLPKDNDENF